MCRADRKTRFGREKQRQEAIIHNDNPTVSVRDGSARKKGTLENCNSVTARITEHLLMWKGGFNEGLEKGGTVMGRREERKEYKEKWKRRGSRKILRKTVVKDILTVTIR